MYFHVQADWSIAEMNAEMGESHAHLYTSQTDEQTKHTNIHVHASTVLNNRLRTSIHSLAVLTRKPWPGCNTCALTWSFQALKEPYAATELTQDVGQSHSLDLNQVVNWPGLVCLHHGIPFCTSGVDYLITSRR
ncbi:uncharacterized protein LOC119726204 [Patiria miniata]|uniref:Uncharacterized protein n=1 Tax=Patiria miniata TaxID=46514 RepID=A0A913ZPM6_PATMI|nr:uncharacterized protein LOC119726204 [Patiria miniata]